MSARGALLLVLLLLGGACGGRESEQGRYTLRFATTYPPQHPFSRADKVWIEHVERAAGGRLRIEPFWSGSLLSASQSLVELRHGVADVAAIQPIYARGGAHALRTQTGFYAGAPGFEQQVAAYRCLTRHFPVLRRELRGLHVLAAQGGNLPGVVTRTAPVRSLVDLRGLRLRAPSELMEVLRTLGADPVDLPMSEVYAALAKGVIDGVVAPIDALRALHLADVARHYAELSIPRGAYPSRAIRAEALARLPARLRAVLAESVAVWESALAREVRRAQEAGRAYARARGMQFTTLSEQDQRSFDRAYNEAALEQARALAAHGVDGEAMFRSAQRWIQRMRGEPADRLGLVCASE